MTGYAVVHFTQWRDGQTVEAVPLSWLVDIGGQLMCYCPKTGRQKAIKNNVVPKGDWELHAVRRLGQKDIADFQAARRKEKKATFTSSIDTDSAVHDESPSKSATKRKSKVPSRYRQSSESHQSASGNIDTTTKS